MNSGRPKLSVACTGWRTFVVSPNPSGISFKPKRKAPLIAIVLPSPIVAVVKVRLFATGSYLTSTPPTDCPDIGFFIELIRSSNA